MNDKLKRLAKNISELLPDNSKSPQQVFDLFAGRIYDSQNDYFRALGGDAIVKIVLYIYSLKETGDFKMGDNMINKLSFISVFYTSGNYHDTECSECEGSGTVRCDNCDYEGRVKCVQCGGDGEDSSGETCDDCQGGGDVYCDQCGGDGDISCYECDGTGEVETDELEYMYSYICTWNSQVENQCYLNERTGEPAMSEYDFDRLSDEFITLFYTEENSKLRNFVEINQVYCVSYWDEPKLLIGPDKFLQIKWDDSGEFDYYRD
jgi:hypothetical protein